MENKEITIIITVWKRPYLDLQLNSLINQSVTPKFIWIIHNERHIDIKPIVDKYVKVFPNISVIDSDLNLKYFGRFSLCYNVRTKYTFIIDDDVIPSKNWLSICLATSEKYNSVVSCTGRIIPPGNFRPEEWQNDDYKEFFIGDCYDDSNMNFSPVDTHTDYGCNSYFFQTKWVKYFWSLWPSTFDSGEDIHLSASLMLLGSIPTIVPQQICNKTTGNLEKNYSADHFSSWKSPGFVDIRQSVLEFLIKEKKWSPLLWD